jgi:tetratricopeptide (TPR) repeat protein
MRTRVAITAVVAGLVGPAVPALAQSAGGTESAAVRAQEASAALLQGNAQQAIALYSEALKDPALPNDRRATLLNDRGVAHWRANQLKAAIDDFNRSVTLFPENASVYNNRGNVLLALNLPQEAIKDFNRAVLLQPGYAAAFHNRANAQLKLGQPQVAIEDFSRAVALAPQSAAPLTGRGQAQLLLNRPYTALRDFSRAIGLDAKEGNGYRNRAEVYLAIDNSAEAIEDLTRAITLSPNKVELYVVRGRAFLAAKNAQSALKDFSKAIELQPRHTGALAYRGLAHSLLSQPDEALADLSRAIELDHRNVLAYVHRAATYRQMGQPETGLRDIERALKLDPKHAEAYRVRGQLHEARGHPDEAVQDYKQAVALDARLREALDALERLTGEARPEAQEVAGAGKGEWRVYQRPDGGLFAMSGRFAKLMVPLEPAAGGEPRIVEWEERAAPFKGIGVLRYVSAGAGGVAIQQAAVVDLAATKVMALEIEQQGEARSKWVWDEGKLVVTGLDGVVNEYALRDSGRSRVAGAADPRRPPRPGDPWTGDGAWSPWYQGGSRPPPRPQQQYKPKTLFELLFKF